MRGRGRENPCRASGWGTGIEQGNEGTGTGQRDGATSVEQVDESKYDAGRWRDKCRAGDRATSVEPVDGGINVWGRLMGGVLAEQGDGGQVRCRRRGQVQRSEVEGQMRDRGGRGTGAR